MPGVRHVVISVSEQIMAMEVLGLGQLRSIFHLIYKVVGPAPACVSSHSAIARSRRLAGVICGFKDERDYVDTLWIMDIRRTSSYSCLGRFHSVSLVHIHSVMLWPFLK